MFFQARNSHTGPLFNNSTFLKSFDETALENCIFISKCHLFWIAGSNLLLSLILTILDG